MRKNTTLILITAFLAIAALLAACATPQPTAAPTAEPTTAPTLPPTAEPTQAPTAPPTAEPTPEPTAEPTEEPLPAISLVDGLGREITLEAPAQRIVSLAPSNTEILFAIGAGQQMVARDSFSDFPADALELADIGGGFDELDTETILSLDPDLVLAADITAPEQIQALEDLGLTVYALPNPITLNDMYENLRTVALLTGREAEAEALIAELQARVAAVEEKLAGIEDRPLVFYELDGTDPNAPWTSGPGTFIDTLITLAGGENVGAVLDGPWGQLSIEELLTQNPDIILLGDAMWAGITAEDVAARPGWDALAAVQNAAVYPFDDNLVSRPGPRLVDGLEALAQLLHPEVFGE